MESIHFHGLLIGIATFLIIGLFHPIVIKSEYYLNSKKKNKKIFLKVFESKLMFKHKIYIKI